MKLLLDIPDNKAAAFLEVLQSISFVKAKLLTKEKAHLLEDLEEAIQEVTLVEAGKKEARTAKVFLDGL